MLGFWRLSGLSVLTLELVIDGKHIQHLDVITCMSDCQVSRVARLSSCLVVVAG